MANRKWHLSGSLIAFIITMAFLYVRSSFSFDFERDFVWINVGFLLALFGGEFPDLDQMAKSWFNHRDWFTHSAIFPGIVSLVAISLSQSGTEIAATNLALLPPIAFFNLGVASHLILDYFPSWGNPGKDGKLQLGDITYARDWVLSGLTGKELVQKLVGSYLIHLPFRIRGRKTLNKTWTRFYFFINAAILIGLAYYMVYLFNNP